MKPAIRYTLIILVTALVAGSGTYLFEHHQATSTKNELNTQVVSLQKQINSLNSRVSSLKSTKTTSSSSKSPAPNVCKMSDLSALFVGGDGAAGTGYDNLKITNTSNQACIFSGVAGLFALNNQGTIVGDAVTNSIANFNLMPGQSIYSDVGFPDPGNFSTGECAPNVSTLAVYPPGEVTPLSISTNNIPNGNYSCPGFSMNAFSTKPTGS